MKWLALILFLIPLPASAFVSGIDDSKPNITTEEQSRLDDAITTYYQHPSPDKVVTVLGIMNNSEVLRRKSAWPPLVGFLTVVFADNQRHLFDWMSLHDYNIYAEDVFVAALLHANLRETALVFAQAHHWKKYDLERVRYAYDPVDLKHLPIKVPGHIDTLWGAFFASGDPVYVNEIIDALFAQDGGAAKDETITGYVNIPEENKKLAESTLKQYAPLHMRVRNAIAARSDSEKNEQRKKYLKTLISAPQ